MFPPVSTRGTSLRIVTPSVVGNRLASQATCVAVASSSSLQVQRASDAVGACGQHWATQLLSQSTWNITGPARTTDESMGARSLTHHPLRLQARPRPRVGGHGGRWTCAAKSKSGWPVTDRRTWAGLASCVVSSPCAILRSSRKLKKCVCAVLNTFSCNGSAQCASQEQDGGILTRTIISVGRPTIERSNVREPKFLSFHFSLASTSPHLRCCVCGDGRRRIRVHSGAGRKTACVHVHIRCTVSLFARAYLAHRPTRGVV